MTKILTISGAHRFSRFGELVEKNGQVRSFTEKPRFSTELISGGFMIFNRGMLDYLTEDEDCDFEMGPLENLAKAGR